MLKAFLISLAINILLSGVIVLLIWLLVRKRQRRINDYNNDIIEREKILNNIENMTEKKKRSLDEAAKKANNFDDFKSIIINQLFD